MTTKIIREDGTTRLSNVKSCTYHEIVNSDTDLRPGCVSSAMIEVVVYGSQTDAPTAGEALTYYQVDSDGDETLIGVFYAEPSIATKMTYRFNAYDAISKLDVDFSSRLAELQSSFPMTAYELVSEACAVAGVTLSSATWPTSSTSIGAFYADNLKCRDIVAYAAEIACRFVRCNTSGGVVFDWYSAKQNYRIYPSSGTSGTETRIAYKQDGLDYENYNTTPIGIISITTDANDGTAYNYPTPFATDDGNGGINFYNVTATDGGSGTITISGDIEAEDGGSGDITLTAQIANDNTLSVSSNLFLTNVDADTILSVAQNIYTTLSALGTYRPASVDLFPNENPFRAGDIVNVTDAQGVSFTTLVMSMETSESVAKLTSTGNATLSPGGSDLSRAVSALNSSINKLNVLQVGSAFIKTAVIDALEAVGINANDVTITGTLHSPDYVYNPIYNYSVSGIGIDLDSKRIAATNFAVTPEGRLLARRGNVAGFEMSDGTAVQYFTHPTTFYDTDGNEDPSAITESNYVVTTSAPGTLTYSMAKYYSYNNSTIQISKIWYRITSGGNTQAGWETPVLRVYYLDSNGNPIHITTVRGVQYISPDSPTGITCTFNTVNLSSAASIRVEFDLSEGDTCQVVRRIGVYSALYTGSAGKLKSEADTVYVGTDGISCGTELCLTPDGHGSFSIVTADTIESSGAVTGSNIGALSDLNTTDKTSLVAAINELYAMINT